MAGPIQLMVNGACGRMGEAVIRLVSGEEALRLTAALERPGHPRIGSDIGEFFGLGRLEVPVQADLGAGDVLVDFSTPESTVERARACAERGIPMVTGTTGLEPPELEVLRQAAEKIPCLHSYNMSLGIALATRAVSDLASHLPADFDVEIVETHHRHKKDAPSGTAIRLATAIARGRGESAPSLVHGRQGITEGRLAGTIGIHAVRMGEEKGEHRVIFSGPSERIEIGHVAHSREAFARGALLAARFVLGQDPGLYDISDVFLPR